MTNASKFSFSLIITIFGIVGLNGLSIYKDHQYIKLKNDSENIIDSLKYEILIKDISIGSYEVMWNTLTTEHPEIVEKIEIEVE